MRLRNLKLTNFKGCRSFILDANGQNINIYGANGTYKTTLFDAFTWVLFDKDSLDRKEFGIKTLDANGEPMHNLQHIVEASLDVDGKEIILRKAYQEQWIKKRGQAKAEFTGHTTNYWIDGVPAKKSEYDAFISDLIDEWLFKLLTNPRHFNEVMPWQKRRELLLLVCGDIPDAEVIASDNKLSGLPEILGSHSMDDWRRIAKSRLTEINKELKAIPVRIDEATRGLPGELGEKLGDVTALRDKLQELQQRKAQASAGGAVAEINKQIAEVDAELLQVKNQQTEKIQRWIYEAQKQEHLIRAEIIDTENNISTKRRQSASIIEEEKELNEIQAKLREKWVEVDQREYQGDNICPVCSQPLPEKMIETAKTNFNRGKAEELEAINKQGRTNKAKLVELKEQGDALTKEINALSQQVQGLEEKGREYQAKLESLNALLKRVERLPEYQTILEKKEVLQRRLSTLQGGNIASTEEIDKEIEEVSADVIRQEGIAAAIQLREQGLTRIEELKAEEKKLATEYEKLEREIFLAEEFIRTKVSLLEEKINSQFELVSFKLFNQLINQGIEETCEVSFQGVPYVDMSNSERIRAGLDVIRALSKHYEIECPVICDNREAITTLPDMGNIQVICLIVSEGDKALRVEPNIKQEVLL